MKSSPESSSPAAKTARSGPQQAAAPPQWQRPRGVAPGTWDYVHEPSIASGYDEFVTGTPLCDVDQQLLAKRLPAVRSGRSEVVLDLGCGSGRSTIPLADRGYNVLAVDLSLPMLKILANKTRESSPAGCIRPIHANLVELDCIAKNSVDHAICLFSTLGMIQGRANRRAMLGHVARIVRSRGSLIVHVHNRWAALKERHGVRSLASSCWHSLIDTEAEFGDTTYAYRGLRNMFMHRYSRRELITDLTDSGWIVETVSPVSIDGSRIDISVSIPGGYLVEAISATA